TAAIAMTPVAINVQLVRGVPVTQWGPVVVVAASIILLLGSVRLWSLLMLLQRQSAALRRVADTDVVTGLANRTKLSSRLSELMESRGRDGAALVLIDLNRFADINQSFGYAVGDQVLTDIGARLTELMGTDGSVARLGGDEFAIVVPGPVDRHRAVAVAVGAQRAVGATLTVRDIKLILECSAGVALSSDCPAPGPDELVQHAYAAVIIAKTRQPKLAVYDRTMDNDRVDQLRRMGELEDAISSGELEVHYQPRLNLRSGRVCGLEALLRWRHPREGMLLPGDFLQSAEQTVMMPAVTAFVIDTAAAACSRWRALGLDVDVAVNLSVRDLVDTTLAQQVRDTLDRYSLPGSAVVFEITETSAMTDPERSIDTLEALRETGVSISIDDFGTGYSSLAYLSALPVQQLKMDRSFVTSIASESANLAIVRSTIELAHSMGLDIVAEGVEDARTVVVLRDLGCDSAQGFHIARPVPASDVVATVRSVDDSSGAAISGV
ncbi:MAG: bifunctional diguanylate cyclase/phosphodiesterase, partial [Rhodococcus sp. (in: high G+C Gram-positive bacteria)]